MHRLYTLLIALILLVPFTLPATAQEGEGPGDNGHSKKVTKTFTLTLYGEIPGDESFFVFFRERFFRGGVDVIVFCGESSFVYPDIEPCQGGSTVYSGSVEYSAGDELEFGYFHGSGPGAEDQREFFEGTETITSDFTNSAYYDYRTGQGGAGNGPGAPDAPDTGSGGMAGGGLPAANALAVLSLMAAGGYILRRRVGR